MMAGRLASSTYMSIPALDTEASAKAAGLRYVTGEGEGISRRRAGKGFWYRGVNGKPVRDKATLDRIRSLVIPPAWEDVWICPLENGHIQAVGRDARGRKQYRYHPRYRQVRDATKFGRMAAFGAVLPQIRQRLEEDLALPGLPQAKVLAVIVRLLDETCIRIGNEEYAKSNDSYGLTTMQDEHVRIRGDNIRFRFRGKSGQEHDVALRDRRLARIVKKCQDLPGEELFQYQAESGEYVRVDSSDVNEYLRELRARISPPRIFARGMAHGTWPGNWRLLARLSPIGKPSAILSRR